MNLIEGLQKEINRVNEIVKEYEDPMLNGAGDFAAALMKGHIKFAENSILNGDVIGMMKVYKELETYKL